MTVLSKLFDAQNRIETKIYTSTTENKKYLIVVTPLDRKLAAPYICHTTLRTQQK